MLPERFLERLRQIVPPERLPGVLAAFEAAGRVAFRVNPLRGSRDQVLEELHTSGLSPAPVAWYADAFTVPYDQRGPLLASDAVARGAAYVQNLASMVPPLALDPQPGERVLDLAAAPGSKTLQMAALMQNEGEIAAVEVVRDRFFRLRANAEAAGATVVRTFLQDGTRVDRYRPDHFDRVLLDAPCSTEGRFRADDLETTRYWSERKVREMQSKQERLLAAGVRSLREGGVLVYSTCSLAPEENEVVLDRLLTTFEGALALEPIPVAVPELAPPLTAWQGKPFAHDLGYARRLLPDGTFEAFFVARLRKTGPTAQPENSRTREHRPLRDAPAPRRNRRTYLDDHEPSGRPRRPR
ncbi:MAG TPA: RsmB/NOP family class I SAM-dependent RNA methyltransferase [Rhodothermales bacterium]|nr:RsmB/NOP family class I SAM-dependent RNA methyltransferase [Rhodothermales bacterium]